MVTPRELDAANQRAVRWVAEQDARRGGRWPRVRDGEAPNPPWPDPQDDVLDYLLKYAQHRYESLGHDLEVVLIGLAITAWSEGHIEGYDRAYREGGGRPSPTPRPPRASMRVVDEGTSGAETDAS